MYDFKLGTKFVFKGGLDPLVEDEAGKVWTVMKNEFVEPIYMGRLTHMVSAMAEDGSWNCFSTKSQYAKLCEEI